MTSKWTVALLAATAMTTLAVTPADAQTRKRAAASGPTLAEIVAQQQRQIDALTAEISAMKAAPAAAPAVDEEAAAQTEFLKAQVDALQAQLEGVKTATAANTAAFKAAPELTGQKGTPNEGFKFKVRGRFMYDTAYVENPRDAIATKDLGFSSRVRRVRLGAEGSLPGGFGYKAEFDFADAAVGYGDVILTWRGKRDGRDSPFELTVGNFESLDGFEQISSSRHISFLERSAFNEAFNNTRRLGAAATYISRDNAFRLSVGAFNDTINADRANDDYILAARATYSPQLFGGQQHFGLNYQHRSFQTNALQNNYQARPFVRNTDTRFVSTGALAVKTDNIYGAEYMGIWGPFHAYAEGQLLKASTLRPTDVLSGGDLSTGARTNANPTFFGFVAEVGYFFTGETRGYKNGLLDRTKVKNPIDKGGPGAWSVNLRYDRLDLSDATGTPGATGAPNFVNGGKQTGYLASMVWQPIDYVRVTWQYTHGTVDGGPRVAAVVPNPNIPILDRSFNYNLAAMRVAFDF